MSGPVAQSKKIAGRVEGLRKQHQQGVRLNDDPAVNGDLHPARYFEEDPRDDYYEAKKAVTSAVQGNAPSALKLGTDVPVTDRDIDYLLDQRTKEEKYNFDKWKYTTYQPGSDPIRIKYFEKIDPGFFKERESQIDHDLDLVKRLALLSLNGVQSEDDVILMYGINMGKVAVPNWKVHFPLEAVGDDIDLRGSVTQGFFNPRRYSTQMIFAYQPDVYSSLPLDVSMNTNTPAVPFRSNPPGLPPVNFSRFSRILPQ